MDVTPAALASTFAMEVSSRGVFQSEAQHATDWQARCTPDEAHTDDKSVTTT